ncbi:MAG TPA: hypothetical protein VLH19_02710 [Patescibacteria group bacterium]|nr:hypothetical protein [Patescibacteria group bacterium]
MASKQEQLLEMIADCDGRSIPTIAECLGLRPITVYEYLIAFTYGSYALTFEGGQNGIVHVDSTLWEDQKVAARKVKREAVRAKPNNSSHVALSDQYVPDHTRVQSDSEVLDQIRRGGPISGTRF